MAAQQSKSTLDGMPKQFVASLKVLFDILDEEKSGLVRFVDIETRWKDREVTGLPSGVVGALKKVTPASGKLTFERFVAGLKIALLRSKGGGGGESNSPPAKSNSTGGLGLGPKPDLLNHDATPEKKEPVSGLATASTAGRASEFAASLPLIPAGKSFSTVVGGGGAGRSAANKPLTTAAVRPNNAIVNQNQRPRSISGMTPPEGRSESGANLDITPPPNIGGGQAPQGPPPTAPSALRNDPFLQEPSGSAQPRTEPRRMTPPIWNPTQSQYNDPYNNRGVNAGGNYTHRYDNNNTHPQQQPGRSKDDIVFALKKWQQNRTGQHALGDAGNRLTDDQRLQALGRTGPTEGRASIALASFDNYGDAAPRGSADAEFGAAASYKRNKKKEPRRHTLANGIDYNMIKRMKQLEQEKDVLLQGLESVERARGWYQKQIHAVQEKQNYIGKGSSPNDTSLEANQERMNFQMARIFEVNQQLKTLVESSEKGYPLHMNLAVSQPFSPPRHQEDSDEQNRIAMLKAQNKMLTQEMSQKNERIAQLEREKSSLIRDMFDARANQLPSTYQDDTTFL